ncbi:MAG: DUF1289 domain-containing protein [Gammaproteobacteria bacterium]|nr:MAG: DUF1289 domain-containing protein [Gammaproteobacteria bacterium]
MSLTPTPIIDSPCVRNCCLNEDDICLGCGRSLREITRWGAASNGAKLAILETAAERRRLIKIRQGF